MEKHIDEAELAKIIGPAYAAEFTKRATAVGERFSEMIGAVSADIIQDTKDDFMQFVSNPELAKHRDQLLETMRLLVLDTVGCLMFQYGAEISAELRTPYGEIAHHVLDHLDSAYRRRVTRTVKDGLAVMLRDLVPPDVKERIDNESGPEN